MTLIMKTNNMEIEFELPVYAPDKFGRRSEAATFRIDIEKHILSIHIPARDYRETSLDDIHLKYQLAPVERRPA